MDTKSKNTPKENKEVGKEAGKAPFAKLEEAKTDDKNEKVFEGVDEDMELDKEEMADLNKFETINKEGKDIEFDKI